MHDRAYLTRAIARLESLRDAILTQRRIMRRTRLWLDQRAKRRAMR